MPELESSGTLGSQTRSSPGSCCGCCAKEILGGMEGLEVAHWGRGKGPGAGGRGGEKGILVIAQSDITACRLTSVH